MQSTIYIYPTKDSEPVAIASGTGISLQKTIYDSENPFDRFAEYSTDFDIEDDKYTPYLYDVLSNTKKNSYFKAFVATEGTGPLEGVVKINTIHTAIDKSGNPTYNTNCTFWAGATYVLSSEIAETVWELFPELTITPNIDLLDNLWGTASTSSLKDYFNLFITDDGVISHNSFRSDLVYSYAGRGKITNNQFVPSADANSVTCKWINSYVFEEGSDTAGRIPYYLASPDNDGHNFYPYLYQSAGDTNTLVFYPIKTDEALTPLEANIFRVWMLRPGISLYEIIKRVVEKGGYTLSFDPGVSQDIADKIKGGWITLKNFYWIDSDVSDSTSFTPYQMLGYLNTPAEYIKDVLRLYNLTLRIDSGVVYFCNPKAISYIGELKGYVGDSEEDKLHSIKVTYNIEDNYVVSALKDLGVEDPLSDIIEKQTSDKTREEDEIELIGCLKRGIDAVPTGECYAPTLVNAYSEKESSSDPDLYWYYPQFLNKGFSIDWIPYALSGGNYYLAKDEYHQLSSSTNYVSPKYYRIDSAKNWVNFEESGEDLQSGTAGRALNIKSLAKSIRRGCNYDTAEPTKDNPARPEYCFHRAPSEMLCLKSNSGDSVEDSYNILFFKRDIDSKTKNSWRTLYNGFFVDGANIFINKEATSDYNIKYRTMALTTGTIASSAYDTVQSNFAIESDPTFRIVAGDKGKYDDGFFFQGNQNVGAPVAKYVRVFESGSYAPLIATNNLGIDFSNYTDQDNIWGYKYIGELISGGSDKLQLFHFSEERIPTNNILISVADEKDRRGRLGDSEISVEVSKAQLYRDLSINPYNLDAYDNIVIKLFTKYYLVEEVSSFSLEDDKVTLLLREYDWEGETTN